MNVAAATRLITTYVVAKPAQVSRFSVDRRSIASQPTETRTRTRLVSFVAWASSNVTAASVSSPAPFTDPGRPERGAIGETGGTAHAGPDRKRTRLNSSHIRNSYAGLCLKKITT